MQKTFHNIWVSLDCKSKKQLAASCDVTKNYLSEIAHKRREPSILLTLGLSKVLEVPTRILFPSIQFPGVECLAIDPGLKQFKKRQLKLTM